MKRWLSASCLALAVSLSPQAGTAQAVADRYREASTRIIARALKDSAAWNRLAAVSYTHLTLPTILRV